MTEETRKKLEELTGKAHDITKGNQKRDNEILEAVQADGMLLRSIRPELQTPEICLAAVKQNDRALQYVKEQIPEICLAIVK